MDDLISRRAAIEALDFEIVHMTAYRDGKNEGNPLAQYNKGLEDGKKAIEALPPTQPERKKGEWSDGYRWQRCSLCKQTGKKSWNYCPNCGAKMTISTK
jgi:hypothetical protein